MIFPARKLTALILGAFFAFGPIAYSQDDDFLSEDDLFDDEFEESESKKVADPLEPINRAIFVFNDFVYLELGRPLANTYQAITPDSLEKGLNNFFTNLGYPVRLTSNVLQARFGRAGKETAKFIINSTIGLGGFFDQARKYPTLYVPKEDIGQALGRWGVGEGLYIVIPILGPSNLRDFVGWFGDRYPDLVSKPWSVVDDSGDRILVNTIEFTADSPDLIELYESYKGSAIDPYSGVRDAYSQRRKQQIKE